MSNYLENFLGTQATTITGNPLFTGLLILAFFSTFVLLKDTKLELKILGIGGGFILALLFLPTWLIILFGIGSAVVIYLAIMKVLNR